ncbi:hypothetical protein [Polyangium mundeleinium]|uniref:Uncharacterized protein n=1 Tax=Polyangium mundeleinium TaxID=2995306 RepID=A0ABT5EP26_9BACT|nr:hypothetical protein [Polyangium mundeleinium]MDC0743595.1 hypothetical protein [Polyangium mundeleinium]
MPSSCEPPIHRGERWLGLGSFDAHRRLDELPSHLTQALFHAGIDPPLRTCETR